MLKELKKLIKLIKPYESCLKDYRIISSKQVIEIKLSYSNNHKGEFKEEDNWIIGPSTFARYT